MTEEQSNTTQVLAPDREITRSVGELIGRTVDPKHSERIKNPNLEVTESYDLQQRRRCLHSVEITLVYGNKYYVNEESKLFMNGIATSVLAILLLEKLDCIDINEKQATLSTLLDTIKVTKLEGNITRITLYFSKYSVAAQAPPLIQEIMEDKQGNFLIKLIHQHFGGTCHLKSTLVNQAL